MNKKYMKPRQIFLKVWPALTSGVKMFAHLLIFLMKKTAKTQSLKKSTVQWVRSVLLIDLVFWALVGSSCIKDSISCLESATFLPYFFYLPFSLIPQPWLNTSVFTGLNDAYVLMASLLFLIFTHIVLGMFLGYIFRKKPLKWTMSIAISFIIVIGLAFIFGSIGIQQEMTSSTMTKMIAVTKVEDNFLSYVDVEWYEGEAAVEAAKNDGCVEACAPNGFYMKTDTGGVTGENINNFEDTKVTLLKQPDMTPEVVSFDKYLEARYECKLTPEICQYYGIGAEYEYFDATFNDGGFISLIEKYVP